MNLTINGTAETISDEMTITELLKVKNVEMPEMVSVELNGEILERAAYDTTTVKDGDQLEFLYFMGGGVLGLKKRKEEVLGILRNFKSMHAQEYGLLSLGLFGSIARNQARHNSDIDICVETKTPDPFVLVHIKDDLEKLTHTHVDIVRMREGMNPLLRNRIAQEGIYV
jgi:thiamine biosynthesis protein ThiS